VRRLRPNPVNPGRLTTAARDRLRRRHGRAKSAKFRRLRLWSFRVQRRRVSYPVRQQEIAIMKLSELTRWWILVIVLAIAASLVAMSPHVNPNIVTAISGIAVAAATLLLAFATVASIAESRDQAQFTQRSLNRPLIIPISLLKPADLSDQSMYDIDFRNVGHGVANNIRGLLMSTVQEAASAPQKYSVRSPLPLAPGDTAPMRFSEGGTLLIHKDNIRGVSLSLPQELVLEDGIPNAVDRRDRVIARLTITYSDIFGKYHASVYDYASVYGHTKTEQWVSVANLDDITQDLVLIDKKKGVGKP
jgi:hypothetical protein